MSRKRILRYFVCLLLPLVMVGCSEVDDSLRGSGDRSEVQFSCYLAQSKSENTSSASTRTTYPDAEYIGAMTTARLKEYSFGVFAQYTGTQTFDYDDAAKGDVAYNFMWNQKVEWDSSNSYWTYSPVKYWPNEWQNGTVDNQDPAATTNYTYGGNVSFFAYAPYQDVNDPASGVDRTASADNDGIVKVTPNTATAGTGSYITYRTSVAQPYYYDSSVDLLWAAQPNKVKQAVNEKVHFLFKHALSKLTISVQGLFDHTSADDTWPEYSDDVDMYTRILIESVDFSNSPLMKQGNMYFAPRPDNASVPYWELTATDSLRCTVSGTELNANLRDAYMDGSTQKSYSSDWLIDTDAATALTNFNALPTGVTNTEKSLFDDANFYYMLIPNKEFITDNPTIPMKVHMVYYVITYDPSLKLNNPKYYSIVKNDILATFSSSFAFEPNKSYKLVLMPGVTTVKFRVEVADGWETPMVMDPVVIDWYVETNEYNVE